MQIMNTVAKLVLCLDIDGVGVDGNVARANMLTVDASFVEETYG